VNRAHLVKRDASLGSYPGWRHFCGILHQAVVLKQADKPSSVPSRLRADWGRRSSI